MIIEKIIIRISYLLMLISALSILLVIGVFFIKSEEEKEYSWCGVQDMPIATCGNPTYKGLGMPGESLFENNCSSCHGLHGIVVGPALSGISKRRPKKWIRQMIKDGNSLKDPYSVALREKYNGILHTKFESFSKVEIDQIVAYLDSSSIVIR